MLNSKAIDSVVKIAITGLASAVVLTACGNSTASGSKGAQNTAKSETRTSYEVPGDHAIGNVDAPVTVVEYASVTCGHCANWHNTVYPDFKKKYVDTGKVRYIFREFPTMPENLARAGFLIANCAGEDKFLDNISIQFKRQSALLNAPDARQAYLNLAKASGMSEIEYEQCMLSEERNRRYDEVVESGVRAGVTGTPTFFINGVQRPKLFLLEEFDEIIAPILGEPLPVKTDEAETETGSTEAAPVQ